MFLAEDADWLDWHTSYNYTWNAVLLPERSELEWSTSSGDGGPRSDFRYSGQDATRRRWSCGDDRMFCMTKMTIVHGSFAVGCSMGFHRGTSARLDVQGSASTMQGGQWVVMSLEAGFVHGHGWHDRRDGISEVTSQHRCIVQHLGTETELAERHE